jgi:hypothetical protein
MKVDFLLPCRIESEDRLRNVITSVTYLLSRFPEATVILKEVDSHSHFKYRALPGIKKYVDTSNLVHIFEESDEKFFHKTKILNDLFCESKNEIVYNYDVDVIVPSNSIIYAYDAISKEHCDVVYPFGCGVYQWAVDYSLERMEEIIANNFDFGTIQKYSNRQSSTIGWGQILKRSVYIDGYMWNENFISWGAEDCEFYYRMNALGYRVGRVGGDIYHFEHGRTFNSHYHNPKFMENHNLWQWMRNQDKETIVQYYEQQEYVKNRRKQLNVSI